MNDIFKDLILTNKVISYMDDILIFTDDISTQCIITNQVLATLQKHNLYLKPKKCIFEAPEVDFFGVIISHGKLGLDPKKVDALASWPTPCSKKDVQQFLGGSV